ncbi:MAG TPA: hypothetical protein VKP88_07250, partial [Candidatus Paceibacterota bacterium]|nr:hypothetical protein [Candidatus Paceibacterota bacterium]
MDLITVDFETFYSRDFSLSKMTTEEYIRSPDFEVIGVAVKVNDEETEWASGTHKQLRGYLGEFDWGDSMMLAHNTMFDAAILNWVFGYTPKAYADTLSMARALHGTSVGGSLAKLVVHYALGEKGTEIVNAQGKRRDDFTPDELSRYGDYCINDVDLTYSLFNAMLSKDKFPASELKIIDATLSMYAEPVLELNAELLESHLKAIEAEKERLLETVNCDIKDLRSNEKFAEILRSLGVPPPKKLSPRTNKLTYAFAKTDPEFKALEEHPDPTVQALVAARLGTKSTIEQTRTQRFIDISKRGLLPIPLKYYAAHTGRWGGT